MPDDVLDRLLAGEPSLPAPAAAGLDAKPRRDLVILTCIDARILPLRVLGLEIGDAHVVRTAGVEVSDTALRDLAISHEGMGTRDVVLLAHSDCRAHDSVDEHALDAVRRGAERIRDRLPGLRVHCAFYDLESGTLTRVEA